MEERTHLCWFVESVSDDRSKARLWLVIRLLGKRGRKLSCSPLCDYGRVPRNDPKSHSSVNLSLFVARAVESETVVQGSIS